MNPRRLRILFVPREPFPTDRVRINVLFGRELAARGHRVDLVAQAASADAPPGPRDWPAGTLWLGPTDGRDGLWPRVRKRWLAFAHDLRLLGRVRPAEYDALVVSDKFLYAGIAAVIARRRGVPFVYWLTFPYPELDLHGARTGTARYPALARWLGRTTDWLLHRVVLPRADHVLVQSERMGRDLVARGADPRRLTPVPTGFAPADFAVPAERAAGPRDAPVTLAYLGTLSADRELGVLVDALALLRARGRDVRLLLVGDAHRPRDREALERHARAAGVAGAVEITGFLPQPAALARVAAADVALSPIVRTPLFDVGSPTKLVEYLALALPVVANDHPEQRAMLAACRAGVCVPWHARHFARAVEWLLRRSARERRAMGERGREYVHESRTYARIALDVERALLRVARAEAAASPRDDSPQLRITRASLGDGETPDV